MPPNKPNRSVLLLGRAGDPSLEDVEEQLAANQDPYVRVTQSVDLSELVVEPRVSADLSTIYVAGEPLHMDQVRSIYSRHTSFGEVASPHGESISAQELDLLRVHDQRLLRFLESFPRLVINKPSSQEYSFSKLDQLILISSAGFHVPTTLVTNKPDVVTEFMNEHPSAIYKSASTIRSIVRLVDFQARGRLDRLGTCPVQFQEYVAGVTYRVHVVASQAFCSKVSSTAVDYRYPGVKEATSFGATNDVPIGMLRRCIRLTLDLGLSLSGVDLIVESSGAEVCLEVNSNPAFAFVDDERIADAVARLLRVSK